ncbi:unnamed protein product [Pseudo-nitzschia multistriata]|uniref:1-phosphatidylinositol 4-kinase n=1 Tax=Pseudo-nitzschia multistriata TaxID=183589 RepID=A0A448ZEC5_9STRA|nr:unnamed protein product [Pseudo-nitzschia multistriata]
MPFLFPALAAASCDVFILYLGHRSYLLEQRYSAGSYDADGYNHDDAYASDDSVAAHRRVYHYGYIVWLAALRLVLLLVPLPYHSFFGKALRCPVLYRLVYGGTLCVVVVHGLALLLIDPQSLGSLATAIGNNGGGNRSDTLHHILVTRSLWVAILLTLVSTLSHVALFFHVRSTAPSDADFLAGGRRRPRVLLYYAKQKKPPKQHHNGERVGLLSGSVAGGSNHRNRSSGNGNGNSNSNGGRPLVIGLPLGSSDKEHQPPPADDCKDCDHYDYNDHCEGDDDPALFAGSWRPGNASASASASNRAFRTFSRKVMLEIQVRLRKARAEWTARLEEYQMLQQAPLLAGGSGTGHAHAAAAVAPFRVLLELYAGDNHHRFSRPRGSTGGSVGSTSTGSSSGTGSQPHRHSPIDRLGAAYDLDNGEALMPFVPQLLSFLLHGAYESSHPLEEWILRACRKNLFFAHKCYWFLRAWSLGSTTTGYIRSSGNTASSGSNATADANPSPSRTQAQSHTHEAAGGMVSRLSHSSSLASFATQEDEPPMAASRLLPEERAVIEDLLRRIMACGETPARLLHAGDAGSGGGASGSNRPSFPFGASPPEAQTNEALLSPLSRSLFRDEDGDSDGDGPDHFQPPQQQQQQQPHHHFHLTPAQAAASGLIPTNPLTGDPSQRHFDCLSARRRHGFLPLDHNPAAAAVPSGSCFDSTPVFMDALVTIADNLFGVPREQRAAELAKQLSLLEVEALPCNEIYVPLQNLHHRVWRIVEEESIAISTKERVPCIVCLEVVDYRSGGGASGWAGGALSPSGGSVGATQGPPAPSERELVDRWRNAPREPYRRETTFHKMKHGIIMGQKISISELRNLQPNIHKMKASMQEMQEHFVHSVAARIRLPSDEGRKEEDRSEAEEAVEAGLDREKAVLSSEAATSYGGAETGDGPSSPTPNGSPLQQQQTSQPLSPRSPRATIQQGAMGQWTKSPAPRKHHVADVAEALYGAAPEDLSAPATGSGYYYQHTTINDHIGGGSNVSRRRFSRSSSANNEPHRHGGSVPCAEKPLDESTSSGGGSFSNGLDYDYDEHDDDEEDERDRYGGGMRHRDGGPGEASSHRRRKHRHPPTKPPPVVFKENWKEKEDRLRSSSAYGHHPGWRLLPVLIKSNDDLRQEQLASQLIQRMALILARDKIGVWLCPNEILALEANGGIIEAIPDTISLSALKKNDPDYTDLNGFFEQYFCEDDALADAKASFCESLAAYSIVCFLLQIKDRHNGNILLDNRGHIIHIDFGFFFLSSPGKNTGFESAPFKLTREFMGVLGGPDSHLFAVFRNLCYRTFLSLRKHCHEIIVLVEMLQLGNEELACFRGRPEDAIHELRQRFRLDLNDRACLEYVNALIDESLENWRTNWYDRYQRYCVGVL